MNSTVFLTKSTCTEETKETDTDRMTRSSSFEIVNKPVREENCLSTSLTATQKKRSKSPFLDRLKNWGTNLFYKMDNKKYDLSVTNSTFMLGRFYNGIVATEFQDYLKTVIWFSYRKNFPKLLKTTAYDSDRGWGCMLRTGQMMFAEIIKRHFFMKTSDNLTYLPTKDQMYELISYFADYEDDMENDVPFGIQRISKIANDEYKLKPGEWYKATTIAMILETLCDQYPKLPTKNLKFAIFIEGTIYEDQILEKAFNQEKVETSEQTQYSSEKLDSPMSPGEESKAEKAESIKKQRTGKWDNSVFVLAVTKTGLDDHNPIYLPTIKQLLMMKQSVGILGGNGTSAHYIIGTHQENVLFLDPHFVQKAPQNKTDLINLLPTYFVEKPFQMKLKDIDTSVGFGFYLKDDADYLNFKATILKARADDPDFLMGYEQDTPQYTYKESSQKQIVELNDDDFEIID
jgi:cysteine protease ATG4